MRAKRMSGAFLLCLLGLLLFGSLASAQVCTTVRLQNANPEHVCKGPVPTSPTSLVSSTYLVKAIVLINSTASAVTCQILDNSTDCSGSGCPLVPISPTPLSISAGQMMVILPGDIPADKGVTWSCSGSGVIGRIVFLT